MKGQKNTKQTVAMGQAAAAAIDPTASIPQVFEIEQSVLGVLLVDNSAASQTAKLQLTTGAFYDPTHSLIFSAIEELAAEGKMTDIQTVGVRLKEQNRLSAVGGVRYLVDLSQLAGSGATLGQHVQILIQTHISRQVLQAAYNSSRNILSGDIDIADVISELTASLEQAQLGAITATNRRHIAPIASETIAALKKREERCRNGLTSGISSGIRSLDRLTSGWQPGQLIVLAARPAMGKTAAMLHFALLAARQNRAVCTYSLEMSDISLVERLLVAQSEGRVNKDNVRRGCPTTTEWDELNAAKERISQLPIYIDDRSNVSMHYIATHSRMMRNRNQCDVVMIDYLQLMDSRTEERGRNREQEVAQTSKAAKVLAKELGIPVILLAQLNRANEQRSGKEPMLSDLRESGAIEQDADLVIFVHRPEYYDADRAIEVTLSSGTKRDIDPKGFGVFVVAKNREGSTGRAKFSYNESLTVLTDFDESAYLQSSVVRPTYTPGGKREVGPNSIHYVPPAEDNKPYSDVPF